MNFVDRILSHPPERTALVLPTAWDEDRVTESVTVTFGELGARIGAVQGALAREGFRRGDRVVVMFGVGLDLYALVLGLLASGMAAVLIDTGMGPKKVLAAMKTSGAKGIVSVHALLRHRWWVPTLWGLKKYSVDSSGLFLRRAVRLLAPGPGDSRRDSADVDGDDHALITFTSGSTGRPKGADRTHTLLTEQHLALAEHFPADPDEIDMPCFPVVTLHNLCCGIPTVLPPVDFRAVSEAPARAVWSWATEHGVTRMSGAPAYVERLLDALEDGTAAAPETLRAVGVGGARVSRELCARVGMMLPRVRGMVLYGSTEAEPIASVDFDDVLGAVGEGVLVGTPADAAEVALVDLPEPAPVDLGDDSIAPYVVGDRDPGELIVRGKHVNRGYLDDVEATRANKLFEPDGTVWHRTGDVARWDRHGRLWLTGRVKDLVRAGDTVLHPYPLEEALDRLPSVGRACLLQLDAAPTVVVQPANGTDPNVARDAAREFVRKRELDGVVVWTVDAIPMDSRHNSKIDRVALRERLNGR